MNEPLISPWMFYLLDVLSPLDFILGTTALLSSIGAILCFMVKTDMEDEAEHCGYEGYYGRQAAKTNRRFKILLAIACVTMLFTVLVPSKSTVIQMYIASKVTPANLNAAADMGEKAADKMIEKIIEAAKRFRKEMAP